MLECQGISWIRRDGVKAGRAGGFPARRRRPAIRQTASLQRRMPPFSDHRFDQRDEIVGGRVANPRRAMQLQSGFVTRDVIPADSIVHRIYVAQAMKRFVAACLGEARVWEYADPYAGLVLNVMPPGTEQPWHYDTNEFIVSMMTQQPEAGGDFEYCPNIRSPQGESYGAVGSVVRGETRAPIQVLTLRPGDLQLF